MGVAARLDRPIRRLSTSRLDGILVFGEDVKLSAHCHIGFTHVRYLLNLAQVRKSVTNS
jgi:hypothetical protein